MVVMVQMRYFDEYAELNFPDPVCSDCGEPCKVIGLDNSFDYAGTHCTHGKGGTHRPEGYGSPVSDCCEAEIR
jgi:hypothetical protein